MDFYFTALYFFVYSFFGWCTEVAFAAFKEHRFVNRGFLNGPACPIYGFGVCAVILFLTPYKSNLLLLYLASVVLVTVLEGVTGWAMDKIFHNKWWDYSKMPFNIGGYVCLLFSLIWGVACVVIMNLIHPSVHAVLNFLPKPLGIVLIIVLGALLLADTYVTASAIFKFNKRLENMEKIAKELHEISDQLGENISSKAIRAMEAADELQDKTQGALEELQGKTQGALEELQGKTQGALEELQGKTHGALEELRERAQDAAEELQGKRRDAIEEFHEKQQDTLEELKEHIAELKQRYLELDRKTDKITERLLRAFPKLESRRYKERLREKQEQLLKRLKK